MPRCKECGSDAAFFSDSALVCNKCGVVLEESQIVSDVTFGENSVGGAVVQGSYVANDQTGARTIGPGGFRTGGGESRQQTIANARGEIQRIANGLRVGNNVTEKAVRYYTLALSNSNLNHDEPGYENPKNFVLGRRSEYTVASCIYAACRSAKTHHMLIDFADAIDVNVFTLGRSYLRLLHSLHLKMEALDPSFYIARFAALLDFGSETRKVIEDASRLVARFKHDWITDGRRPAGIAGAALLLAARMNHFRRSIIEVVQVVKMADITLRKRLEEFRSTASGKLSIEDFRKIWLEEEAEPPSVYLARLPKRPPKEKEVKKRRVKKEKKEEDADISFGALEELAAQHADEADADDEDAEDGRPSRKRKRKDKGKGKGKERQVEDEEAESDAEGWPSPRASPAPVNEEVERLADEATMESINQYLDSGAAKELNDKLLAEEQARLARAQAGKFDKNKGNAEAGPSSAPSNGQEALKASQSQQENRATLDRADDDDNDDDNDDDDEDGGPATIGHVKKAGSEAPTEGELAGLDEEELDALILSPEEVRIKERVWMEFNKDYLEQALEKQLKMEADIKAGIKPKGQTKRKKKTLRDGNNPTGASAGEAATQMMKKRSFSKKINYDVLTNLFPGSPKKSKKDKKRSKGRNDDGEASDGSQARTDRNYFSESEMEIVEEDDELPANHPMRRKMSKQDLERQKKRGRSSSAATSFAGDATSEGESDARGFGSERDAGEDVLGGLRNASRQYLYGQDDDGDADTAYF